MDDLGWYITSKFQPAEKDVRSKPQQGCQKAKCDARAVLVLHHKQYSSWLDLSGKLSYSHTSLELPEPLKWLPVDHCGRNTHFRQICFAVPNFNFIYIYLYKIKKITWQPTYFLKKYSKTGNQRKLPKWREEMHPICCYSSSENIYCHSIQAARKKYENNIKRALDFYYYSLFLYGNI